MILSLSSCKKDFLELPSETNLSTPIFFKTQEDFVKAVNGAYEPLRTSYARAWVMGEMRSDNTHYYYSTANRGTLPDAEPIADFIEVSTNRYTTEKYVSDYLIIARVNQVLDLIDGVHFDQVVNDNLKGQSYFLRAIAYFDLVQYFGKVPLHLKPVKALTETYLPLSSTDSVYMQITADAQQAASLLPPKSTQEAGRATSGAAKTLLGNVYMVQKKWPEAEVLFKEVVSSGEYALQSDYASVFSPANKNNKESIMEVQYKEGTEGYASDFIYQFLPNPMTASEVGQTTGIAAPQALGGEGGNAPTPNLVAAYETGDKRFNASIGTTVANGISFPYIKKYNHPHINQGLTNDNFPVYRYAEVLLFLAEALNEQGKTSEALPYLNQVRTRAGLGNSTAPGQAEVRAAIAHERRIELAFENKRWLDLLRTGKAVEVMTAYGIYLKAHLLEYYFPAGITIAGAAYTNIKLLFELPASEAALSPYF